MRSSPAVGALLVPLVLFGCTAPLFQARLDPPPRSTGPLSITVPVAEMSWDVFAPRGASLGPDDEIRLTLDVENTSGAPAELALADLTLIVDAHGGKTIAASPIAGGDQAAPSAGRLTTGRLVLEPGGRARLWASFVGFAGMPTEGAAAARLRVRDSSGTRELPLATPGRPGPIWRESPWYGGAYLQSGVDSGSRFASFDALAIETFGGRGGLLFGLIGGFGLARTNTPESIRYVPLTRYGARLGWMSRSLGLGGVVGVDRRSGNEPTPEQPAAGAAPPISLGATSMLAAVRYNVAPSSPSPFGTFAINAPRSPMGHFAIEIGYVRWLTGEPFVSGGGLHVAISGALLP
jgi:hypothetical protein